MLSTRTKCNLLYTLAGLNTIVAIACLIDVLNGDKELWQFLSSVIIGLTLVILAGRYHNKLKSKKPIHDAKSQGK